MEGFKSKYISINQINSNQFEIAITNGDFSFKETDILKIEGENYHSGKNF